MTTKITNDGRKNSPITNRTQTGLTSYLEAAAAGGRPTDAPPAETTTEPSVEEEPADDSALKYWLRLPEVV